MKTTKNKQRLLSLAVVLLFTNLACNKTPIEEVSFPKRVELLVGQYCFPQVVLDEYLYSAGTSSYSSSSSNAGIIINGDTIDWNTNTTTNNTNSSHRTYIFKNWVSDNAEIAVTRGDTLVALSSGVCELTALYHDNLGDHTVTCSIVVNDLAIPNPQDTIFTHSGDTIMICEFDVPGVHTIYYELEYSSGYIYSSHLYQYYSPNNDATYFEPSPIKLSPLYTYYMNMIVPEFGITSARIFCEPLGMDVTIPIIMTPSDKCKGL